MNLPAASRSGYPSKPLGEVVEFLDRGRRDLAAAKRSPGPYPYYGASGQQGAIDAYLFDEPLVLLAEDLSGFVAGGKPFAELISGKTWVNTRIHVLRPRAGLAPDFLCRVLESFDFAGVASGAKQVRLSKARASAIRVPLPPLAEQREIAAILGRAEQMRDKRRQVRSQLDAFVRMCFLERFGDPVSNPRRWPLRAFGTLGENQDQLRSMSTRKVSDRARQGIYPRYGACGILDWSDEAPFDGERLLIAADGSNLLTRLGPVSGIARGRFAVSAHAHVIAANGRADLHYLGNAIELTELKPYLSSVARPKLARAALERIAVPVPPLALQDEFRRLVERLEALKKLQETSSERLDELYDTLRARAMQGELFTTSR